MTDEPAPRDERAEQMARIDARIEQNIARERVLAGEVDAELREYRGGDPWGASINPQSARASILTCPEFRRGEITATNVPVEDPSRVAVSVTFGGRAPVVREAESDPEAFCLAARDALRVANEERRWECASRKPTF